MQKLAIIADIHGNVAALEAVLADIRALGVADIVNLGDCVSGPLWPRETMAELQRLALPTVRGNHDRWLGEIDRASMGPSDAFAFDQLTAAQIANLGRLPPQLRLDRDIVAIHGTPRSDVGTCSRTWSKDACCRPLPTGLAHVWASSVRQLFCVDTPIRPASCARGKTC